MNLEKMKQLGNDYLNIINELHNYDLSEYIEIGILEIQIIAEKTILPQISIREKDDESYKIITLERCEEILHELFLNRRKRKINIIKDNEL